MKKLSSNLKKLLTDAKISENELARRTGISQQIINRILSGSNTNPKIATLAPLANYFMVSIGQLIESDLTSFETKLNSDHLGWREIPLIDIRAITQGTLNELLTMSNNKFMVDINSSSQTFAVKMSGCSMEPRFFDGTTLVFDAERQPITGDFVLLCSSKEQARVMQFFEKNDVHFVKCLNPNCSDYELSILAKDVSILGTLIQSRTDYLC